MRGKQGRKPRIPAGLSVFPRVLPNQAMLTPCDSALRAFLLPGVLGLRIPGAGRPDYTISSKEFNQNTKDSRTWLHHLWSGVAIVSPCGSGQTQLINRERKMKQLFRDKQKIRHHVNLRTDVETSWPANRLPALPSAAQSLVPAIREVMFPDLSGILFLSN